FPLRRQHHDRGGMRKLAGLLVVLVAEPGGLRERRDVSRVSGKEMPTLLRAASAITLQSRSLLGGGHLRRFARVDAHVHNVKFLAHIEFQDAERAGQSSQHFAAQHRTLVVAEIENDWLLSEIS